MVIFVNLSIFVGIVFPSGRRTKVLKVRPVSGAEAAISIMSSICLTRPINWVKTREVN